MDVFGLVDARIEITRLDVGLKRALRYPLSMIDQSLIAKVISLSPAEVWSLLARFGTRCLLTIFPLQMLKKHCLTGELLT
jgi:hypothetical protein